MEPTTSLRDAIESAIEEPEQKAAPAAEPAAQVVDTGSAELAIADTPADDAAAPEAAAASQDLNALVEDKGEDGKPRDEQAAVKKIATSDFKLLVAGAELAALGEEVPA